MGTVCATTGLRISETLGLKWEDIDFMKGQANVLRSVVDGSIGRCKTEVSQQPVPLDALTLAEIQSWRAITMYSSDADWLFASDRLFGKMPIWAKCFFAEGLTACCEESWHHQADRLAYLPAHLQFVALGIRQRCEGCAGSDAAREDQHDDGGLYACPHGKKA